MNHREGTPRFSVLAVLDRDRFGLLIGKAEGRMAQPEWAYFWFQSDEGLSPSNQILKICGERCYPLDSSGPHVRIVRELASYAREADGKPTPPIVGFTQAYPEKKGYPDVLNHFFERGVESLRNWFGSSKHFTKHVLQKRRGYEEFVGRAEQFGVLDITSLFVSLDHDGVFAAIHAAHQHFGGRLAELDRLRRFATEAAGGYFFVTGPSGFGKTALLSRFVQSLTGASIGVAAHFITPHLYGAKEKFCLANLCEQLGAVNGVPVAADQDEWTLVGLYRKLLCRCPAMGRRVVVVIDGLDEALGIWRPNSSMFPPNLPDGVHVVFSARPVAGVDWLKELRLDLPDSRVINLEQLTREDTADALRHSSALSLDDAAQRTAGERLFELSEGDPFYLHELLLDLIEHAGDTACLEDRPIGASAYLDEWWRRGSDACASVSRAAFGQLMAYLAAAQVPVPRNVLVSLSKDDALSSDIFRSLVDSARRQMIGNDQSGYELSHRRIVEFVARETQDRADRCKAAFADYCKNWRDAPTGPARDYALKNGPRHLMEAKRLDQLKELLLDVEWIRAKLATSDVFELISDCELARGDQDVEWLYRTLRLSSHVLAEDEQQLASQLHGRLPKQVDGPLERVRTATGGAAEGPWLRPLAPTLASPIGAIRFILRGHKREVLTLDVLRNGTRAVSASLDGSIIEWDLHTGQPLHSFVDHKGCVSGIAYLRNGTHILAVGESSCATVWDLTTEHASEVFAEQELHIEQLCVTPDERLAAFTCDDGSIDIWNLGTRSRVRRLPGPDAIVNDVALTDDGQRAVSVGEDRLVRIWDAQTGDLLFSLPGHTETIKGIAITGDGRAAVSASADETLKVWDIAEGRLLRTLEGHTGPVYAVALSSDGQYVVSGSADRTIRVWRKDDGVLIDVLAAHTDTVSAVKLTSDGQHIVSGGFDGTVRVWAFRLDREAVSHGGSNDPVEAVAMSADGTLAVSGSLGGTLTLWDAVEGDEIRKLGKPRERIRSLAITCDGQRVVCGTTGGAVRVIDMYSDQCVLRKRLHVGSVEALTLTDDGQHVVSGGKFDHGMVRWRLDNGRVVDERVGPECGATTAATTKSGACLVCAARNDRLVVWDLEAKEERLVFGQLNGVNAILLLPDGQHALTSSFDGKLRIWDLEGKEPAQILAACASWAHGAALLCGGTHVVSVEQSGTATVWEVGSGNAVARFTGDGAFSAVAAAPDGRSIIVGEASGRVHLLYLENMT